MILGQIILYFPLLIFLVSDIQCARKFPKDATSNVERIKLISIFLFVNFFIEWCGLNIDTQKNRVIQAHLKKFQYFVLKHSD